MLGVLGVQTCRQYPVHRVTRNYIPCLGQRGKKQYRPRAHPRVGHVGEYPLPRIMNVVQYVEDRLYSPGGQHNPERMTSACRPLW